MEFSSKIFLATSNEKKYQMIQELFGNELEVERKSADIHEIQSVDREEVVEEKAKSAYEYLKNPVIADDFSFYLDGLGNFPGPLIKYVLKETDLKGVKALNKASEGTCSLVCSVAFYDGENMITAEGQLDGVLNFENADPSSKMTLMSAFIPEGYDDVLADLNIENHRHKAYLRLKEKLQNA